MSVSLRSYAFALVVGVSALLPTVAMAGSKALALKVSGSIATAPVWQDASNAVITQLDFAFSGMAGDIANVEVASATMQAKVVNAPSAPTIALARPKGCKIGTTGVSDTNVIFVVGASDMTADGNFSMSDGVLQTFGMKFAAAGGYGSLSGNVTCTTDGSMTYSY